MEQLPDTNPYRQDLAASLHAIEKQIEMEMADIVLIMMSLNTEEKIVRFAEWVLSKLNGEMLEATAPEILRAAVRIGDGRTDLP